MTGKTSGKASAERRSFPRVSTRLCVNLQLIGGERITCTVLDASVSGVRVEGEATVPIGSDVTLIMPGSVHFGGRVVRHQGGNMGIEFSHAPERVAEMISDLLPALQASS
ncbi:PilZ domain-containing protein [Pelagibius sp. Alg239-R121]|uniref:PilZ domain-containing protein n=1 Tax=Pelagibius sp. Alg239-R121 TaxID=2993448 RepID=UPI0024A68846|nr:PilZ domain-containing protein [Pelagibius sp. Alg239-R121]